MEEPEASRPGDLTDRPWTDADVPDQRGRHVIVTGANSGLGFEASRVLARRGAHVVLACRDTGKGEAAAERIVSETPGARCEVALLDLAQLSSVRRFAEERVSSQQPIDALILNAGIMAVPYATSADGFEMQFGTNHLGHFALTGPLLPALRRSAAARIVVVSSEAHRLGRIELLDDPLCRRHRYRRWQAYGQSKLANLLFMFELNRRLAAAGERVFATAAHPGYAATALQGRAAALGGPKLEGWVMAAANALIAQSAAAGAWPILRAAVDPAAHANDYFGPSGWRGMRGPAVRVQPRATARDAGAAAALWVLSEQLTGVRYLSPPG